jgi:hypothetical protein
VALDKIAERLANQFPRLPADQIVSTIQGHYAQFDEATLKVTRIARRITNTETVTVPTCCAFVNVPLAPFRYTQPFRTTDVYVVSMQVFFPRGCAPSTTGFRWAELDLFGISRRVGNMFVEDDGTGNITKVGGQPSSRRGLRWPIIDSNTCRLT